ncbi:integrase core domain-containing protein [Acidobacteria bacterium AH-259-A15]|nr:integrase core domain-containing protein [Acidobacteria bacterium AH-259-A15]
MPWKRTDPMEERMRFVMEAESDIFEMSELCQRYAVSRKTGYKWLQRYGQEGVAGLQDRSRAPRHCPHRTPEAIGEVLMEARHRHPHWGAGKLVDWLKLRQPEVKWPAASTAQEILKQAGLIEPKRRRHRRDPRGSPLQLGEVAPHEVLTADFKGEFRTGDRRYCYPLTIADYQSRYLLACRAFCSTAGGPVERVFREIFREYGLPRAIVTDNGTPFASTGVARLSRLSVWWIRLGIQPLRIQPGHPEQNPRHERMHRTLKEETSRPPARNRQAQQRVFDRFRAEYNQERPHQGLQAKTPAQVYRPSPRAYPRRLPPLEYPGHFEIRRVSPNGCLSFKRKALFLSGALKGQKVGLEEIEDAIWSFYFGPLLLGRYDERQQRLHRT